MSVQILQGDCLETMATLPAESVQCVVTSPPYWGLRDYGTASWEGGDPECEHSPSTTGDRDRGNLGNWEPPPGRDGIFKGTCRLCGAVRVDDQLGLEEQLDCVGWATGAPCGECFTCNMVAVFRQVRRVLRKDGTCWVNLGDCYTGSANAGGEESRTCDSQPNARDRNLPTKRPHGLKPKDLCCAPHRVALALQADGWWLRSTIIWAKPNPMPESCTDRPTTAHEYVFLFTKAARYYYDADAIREPLSEGSPVWGEATSFAPGHSGNVNTRGEKGKALPANPAGRNKRTVWTIPTHSFGLELCRACGLIYEASSYQKLPQDEDGRRVCRCGAVDWLSHFATFPPNLVKPCILAGTSAEGCCPECGAPWERCVEVGELQGDAHCPQGKRDVGTDKRDTRDKGWTVEAGVSPNMMHPRTTTGWQPGCTCNREDKVPCVVLDCFAGAGTTLMVAQQLGRSAIGCELNPEYVALIERRLSHTTPGLPLEV